jgi:collagenase-like PrtC family protease
MELTLGPILFEWNRDEALSFYDEVSKMPVTRVYLGEVVCVKKRALSIKDMEQIGRMLEGSGKKVTVSTLAVVSNEEELELVREVAALPFSLEANDVSALNIIESAGKNNDKEVFAGPHITTYNTEDIGFLKGVGVKRITFPVELPRESVKYNIDNTGVEAEVFAHGKVPLAFSWRCYTSRAFGRTKTTCLRDCLNYPDGMEIKTLDGEPAFTINGTSVLSALTLTLAEFIEDLNEMGVKALRISPQKTHTAKVIEVFRKRLDGLMGPEEALEELKPTSPQGFCNGWYRAAAGRKYLAPAGV